MKRVEHIKCIYSISCPISNEVVYVGATCQYRKRLYQHLKAITNSPLHRWIKQLRAMSLEPVISIVEVTPENQLRHTENKWIKYFTDKNYILFNGYLRNGDRYITRLIGN